MLLGLVVASVAAYLIGWREAVAGLPGDAAAARSCRTIQWEWVRGLSGSALAIALLGLLEAIAIAKSIAAKTRQPVDCNRQCLAEGLANLGGGFFQCMPGSGSLTRSAINFQAGAVSRLSGDHRRRGVALAVLLFADLARYVPRPALAGILLVTAWRLVDREPGRLLPAGVAVRPQRRPGDGRGGGVREHRVLDPDRRVPVVPVLRPARQPRCASPSWPSAPSASSASGSPTTRRAASSSSWNWRASCSSASPRNSTPSSPA